MRLKLLSVFKNVKMIFIFFNTANSLKAQASFKHFYFCLHHHYAVQVVLLQQLLLKDNLNRLIKSEVLFFFYDSLLHVQNLCKPT